MSGAGHQRPSAAATLANELRRRSLRGVKRLVRPLWMQRLATGNAESRAPVTGDGPVVSITTYEPRWRLVFYTLESIAAGDLRPSRLMLWVAPSVLSLGMPLELERLTSRGLEIRTCEDVGPHKKYFPAVLEGSAPQGLVTADDDVLYPADWLARLAAAARARPRHIHAHRAHVVAFAADGAFLPYAQWPACRSTAPSALHFSTGVGGVWYPPTMQDALRAAGDGFRAVCPKADDIWLNATAWRAGIAVCQVAPFHPLLFEIPGTRAHGLAKHNVETGGNDRQLAATYGDAERAQLRALVEREYGGSAA